MIIPWLSAPAELVLIRQFRPPAEGYVIEFPAGLIDEGESEQEAAVRELYEETGFHGSVNKIIPPTFNTPGLSGETVYHVFMEIDRNNAKNINPRPAFDEGEHIETCLVQKPDIKTFLEKEISAGSMFDSKVMAYLQGLISL